jgi:hypothetical protein
VKLFLLPDFPDSARIADMKRITLFATLLLSFCGPLLAETVYLPATQDNTLYESPSGRLSNGAGEYLFAGLTNELVKRRAVIAFKNLNSIPQGATIASVKLHMHVSRENSNPEFVELFRLTRNWGEGTSKALGNEGGGTNSTTDDATWAHRFWPNFEWTTPGGDFVDAPSAGDLVGVVGDYTFGPSVSMTADVQLWLDQPDQNFGWILIGGENIRSTKRFDSRENSIVGNRPVLEISYKTTGTAYDYSGPWSDPSLDGEGYLIYQTSAGWIIYYFGYSAEGGTRWLASYPVTLENLEFDVPFELDMVYGEPGTFAQPTPSADLKPYGSLTVTFHDCYTGEFILDGLDGKKTSNVSKIIGVDGTDCLSPLQ